MEQHTNTKRRIGISGTGIHLLAGDLTPKRHSKAHRKKRTMAAYQRKKARLLATYKRLSKGEKFRTKYSTFESFLNGYKLKEPTK